MKQTYECLWYSEIQEQLEKYDLENRQAEHIVDRQYVIFIAETNIDGWLLLFSLCFMELCLYDI